MIEILRLVNGSSCVSWAGTGGGDQLLQDGVGMGPDHALVVGQVGGDTADSQLSTALPVTVDMGLVATRCENFSCFASWQTGLYCRFDEDFDVCQVESVDEVGLVEVLMDR